MAFYRVTFTPSGPYFFGNEKTFKYPGQTVGSDFGSLYYIKSEKMPSQTALLGALRYILMPEKGFDKLDKEANVTAIGSASFDIDCVGDAQTFGKIKKLSPVFIRKGEEYFIPTPFDHNIASEPKSEEQKTIFYAPLNGYGELDTIDGHKLYLKDYEAKKGITDSFMSLSDNHLEKNLFEYDVRIGVNRKNHQDGFFKKEYIALASEYAFSIFATIDDNSLDSGKYTVLMGQGKVPFAVSFEKADENCEKNFYDKIAEKLKGDSVKYPRIYCLSDMLVNESGMYNGMLLAITKTRDFRSFKTENGGSVKKGMLLHRLISAGSVFIPQEPIGENFLADWAEATAKQKNAANIGFNKIISIEKGK